MISDLSKHSIPENVIASYILKKILHWTVYNYNYVDWLAVEQGVCYNL